MNLQRFLFLILSLLPLTAKAAPISDLPGNQYALVLQERLLQCDIWLDSIDKAFAKHKIDAAYLQPWKKWQLDAKKTIATKPTNREEREAWVASIHHLFQEHKRLSGIPPQVTETFPISVRGMVKNPQTIEIKKKGTSLQQVVEKVGGLNSFAKADFFALYRNGSGAIHITSHSLSKPVKLRPGDMIVFTETIMLETWKNQDPFSDEKDLYKAPIFPIRMIYTANMRKSNLFEIVKIVPASPSSELKSTKTVKAALASLEKHAQYNVEYEKLGYSFAMLAAKTLYHKTDKTDKTDETDGSVENIYPIRPLINTYLTKVAEAPETSLAQLRHILNFLTLHKASSTQESILNVLKKRFPKHWSGPVYQVLRERLE